MDEASAPRIGGMHTALLARLLALTLLPAPVLAQSQLSGLQGELVPPARVALSLEDDQHCGLRAHPVGRGPRLSVRDRQALISAYTATTPAYQGAPCSTADFAALSGTALVDALGAASGNCLSTLWSFDGDVAIVLSESNLALVSAAILADAASLSVNAQRIENLMRVQQIAFYHEFYNASLTYTPAAYTAAQQGHVQVAASADFMLETTPLKDVRAQWIISIDSANGTHLVLASVQALLERFLADPGLASVFQERVVAFNAFFTMARQVGNQNNALGAGSPWVGLVSSALLDVIDDYALDLAYTPSTQSLTENALFVMGNFSVLDAPTVAHAHATLTTAYQTFPQYSGPWFRALRDLDYYFGAQLFGGGSIDIASIQADVADIALPNTYIFDNGSLVFRTAVPLTTAEELYDAIQEADSQFFRKTTFIDPVPGDSNEVLTLVIYGSPDDYALYQPFLYGLPTNNGGIFIEGSGTLFTYERTPQQSTFTLEELLRHEYIHFLDSRYMITGGFYGAGTLYTGGRIDTYTEGMAEYLVGATRSMGVLPRRTLLQDIANDASRMTVAEILASNYSAGFVFYPYAGMLLQFLDAQRPETQVELFAALRSDNAAAVDALYASLSADAQLQADYDAYLLARIAEVQAQTGLFAEDVPTAYTPPGLAANQASNIQQSVDANVSWLENEFGVWAHRFNNEGTLSLPIAALTPEAQRVAFDAEMQSTLTALEGQGAHFATAVTWFGNLRTVGANVHATCFVEGPLPVTAADATPPSAPTGLAAAPGLAAVQLAWNANSEADFSTYRVYRSDISGGPYTRVDTGAVAQSLFDDVAPAAGAAYYVVTATDAVGNESGFSGEVLAAPAPRILIVNGYYQVGNLGYVDTYADELDTLGFGYDVWDPFTQGEPTAGDLLPYAGGVVIWAIGYFHPSFPTQLPASRQAVLTSYLDAGGSLVFSGAFTSTYLAGTSLYTNYFHVSHVQNTSDLTTCDPVPGNVLDNQSLQMTSGTYVSEVDPSPPAVAAFTLDPASGPGAIQSSGTALLTVDDGYRVAYLAFPITSVTSTDRGDLVGAMLDWMIPVGDPPLGTSFCAAIPNGATGLPALITATGSPSVGSGVLTLHSGPMAVDAPGLFYYGPFELAGLPFGNGLRCVGGSSWRLLPPGAADALGVLRRSISYTSVPAGSGPGQIQPGSTWKFQSWYRDASFGAGFNLSDGLSVTFAP
jgi:hypothetical protein